MRIYNRIAGRNKERLAALSDGVFAFAVTVLIVAVQLNYVIAPRFWPFDRL
jgi:uncharacterized membrane protein